MGFTPSPSQSFRIPTLPSPFPVLPEDPKGFFLPRPKGFEPAQPPGSSLIPCWKCRCRFWDSFCVDPQGSIPALTPLIRNLCGYRPSGGSHGPEQPQSPARSCRDAPPSGILGWVPGRCSACPRCRSCSGSGRDLVGGKGGKVRKSHPWCREKTQWGDLVQRNEVFFYGIWTCKAAAVP